MKYYLGIWHDHPDGEPEWIFVEVSNEGHVLRRIDRFPPFSFERASAAAQGLVSLQGTIFSVDDTDNHSGEFSNFVVDPASFEEWWQIAGEQ